MRKVLIALIVLMVYSPAQAQTTTIPTPGARIAVIGDSLTRGLSATHEGAAFANLIAADLDMQLGRYGVGGIEQAEAVANKVIHWRPEVILLQVGINDTDRMTPSEWGERYAALVAKFQGYKIRVIASTLFVAAQPPDHPRHKQLRALSDEVEALEGVEIADVWSATADCPDCMSRQADWSPFPPHYKGDGFHPGDYGHQVIAGTFLSLMRTKTFMPLGISGCMAGVKS